MAILEVKGLTMRFGGLTAVNKVDFAVEQGQIFSVIGPNGAGKTTVFNAVTGVYEPTEGNILFKGQDLRRPFRPVVGVTVALIGLLTGLTLAVLSANIDSAWRAVITLNCSDPGEPFPVRKAWKDFKSFLRADVMAEREVNRLATLEIKEKEGKYLVRSRGTKTVLESHDDPEVAERRLEILESMMNLAGSTRTTVRDGGKWHVLADNKAVLETFESREKAKEKLLEIAVATGKLRWKLATRASRENLGFAPTAEKAAEEIRAIGANMPAEVRRQIATQRMIVGIAFFFGLAVGAGGAFVVWSRSRRTPDVIARRGLARTFQNIRLFPDMLAIENVLMGMDGRLSTNLAQMALHSRGFRAEEKKARARALELLDFVGLRERAGMPARNLPYGDQRRLEIARALATAPSLLLLDEPAAGMNPSETGDLMNLIRKIRDTGVTVLLIEHHMKVVMGISDRIVVLDYGTKIAEGTPGEVRANPKVIEAYLGKEEVT